MQPLFLFLSAFVLPLDYVIHPGDAFTVNCTLMNKSSDVDPANLYFKHQLPGTSFEEASLVATEAHQVMDDNTTQIHVTNVKLSDAGFYKCYYQDRLASVSTSFVQIGGMGNRFSGYFVGLCIILPFSSRPIRT